MNASKRLIIIALSSLLLGRSEKLFAQKHADNDTSYYETFWHHLTTRLYMAQKFTHFSMPSNGSVAELQYVANPKLNLGIGVTWHNLSANIFYGFGYLNNKDTVKGSTKGLDLQIHLFPRKWVIDLYVVMPRGFHLNPKGYATSPNKYYYRPDVKERIYGFSMVRVPNKAKFSYRAALNNNEWQKKSAGSWLYGAHGYYIIMERENEDSLLVPSQLQGAFPKMNGISEARFWSFGPCGGYGYTLVMNKHFYIMLSLVLGLDINIMTEEHGELDWRKNTRFAGTLEYKTAVGYNGPDWGFSFSGAGGNFMAKGASTQKYDIKGGQFKFALTKKIDTKKKPGKK
ncbi:MAG TPA: DUF4421 family protein [Chitinophagaceae bacterium]|nr:DUF4421 family protein [Chitinophagaceae bacterium]